MEPSPIVKKSGQIPHENINAKYIRGHESKIKYSGPV